MIISDHGAIWDRVSFEMPRHRKLELDAHRCLLTYRWMHQSDGIRIKCLLTGARLRWLVGRGRDFSLRLSAVTPGYWFFVRHSNDTIDKWSYCRLMTILNFYCAASHAKVAASQIWQSMATSLGQGAHGEEWTCEKRFIAVRNSWGSSFARKAWSGAYISDNTDSTFP